MMIRLYDGQHEELVYWINMNNYSQTEVLHFFGKDNCKKLQGAAFIQRYYPNERAKIIAELLGSDDPQGNLENLQRAIGFPINKIFGPGLLQLSNGILIAAKVTNVNKTF